MSTLGSNAAGLNHALEIRMRHILDQENWLAQPEAAAPAAPAATAVPAASAALPPLRGVPNPAPTVTLSGGGHYPATSLFAVLAVVVGCVALFNLVDGAAVVAARR